MNSWVKAAIWRTFFLTRSASFRQPILYQHVLLDVKLQSYLSSNAYSFNSSERKEILDVLEHYDVKFKGLEQKIVSIPLLSRGNRQTWQNLIEFLLSNGCRPNVAIDMVLKYPGLLKIPVEKLQLIWSTYRDSVHKQGSFKDVLINNPTLLTLPQGEIIRKIDHLRAVVQSNKHVTDMLKRCPQIMFQSYDELCKVTDYLSEVMIVRNASEYYKSTALGWSLKEIMVRHVFLKRCGKFKAPRLKQSESIPTGNPSLQEIYDSSEEDFATKVAGLTLEEFVVFQAMFEEEFETLEYSGESEEDSDSE